MVNTELLSAQANFLRDMHHVIQVTSYGAGHDNNGARILDGTTTRQYNCLIQQNENTRWNVASATDDFPYVAYVISTPIGQTDAVPIRVEEQITIITPSYWASSTPRRMGNIQSYPDQYGNLFVMKITFQ